MIESNEWALTALFLIIALVVVMPYVSRANPFTVYLLFAAILLSTALLLLMEYVPALFAPMLPYGDHLVALVRGDLSRPATSEYYTPDVIGLYGWYLLDVAIIYTLLSYLLLRWMQRGAVLPLALILVAIAVIFAVVVMVDLGYAGISAFSGLGEAEGFSLPEGG
jgi:hypothetical protein